MEKPQAVACRISRRASLQLSVDIRFYFGELYVAALGRSQDVRLALANGSRRFPAAVLPHLSTFRLVLDRWLPRRIVFAPDPLGKRRVVRTPFLFCYEDVVPGHSSQALPVPFFATRSSWSTSRLAKSSHLASGSVSPGIHHVRADDLRVELRGFVGAKLGSDPARVLPGRGRLARSEP